jgi:hypothetical protein
MRDQICRAAASVSANIAEGQVDHATAATLRDRGDEVGRILSGLIRSCHERRRTAVPR